MKKMTKDRFKELCTNGAHLYIARVYNEEESFYKIGITSKESAYNRLLNLPYNFRILQSRPRTYIQSRKAFDISRY